MYQLLSTIKLSYRIYRGTMTEWVPPIGDTFVSALRGRAHAYRETAISSKSKTKEKKGQIWKRTKNRNHAATTSEWQTIIFKLRSNMCLPCNSWHLSLCFEKFDRNRADGGNSASIWILKEHFEYSNLLRLPFDTPTSEQNCWNLRWSPWCFSFFFFL